MSFSLRNLSVLAYANGFTLWHYKATQDALPHTTHPGYFADAADLMAAGDLVMLTTPTQGRIAAVTGAGPALALVPVG
jgi:hypothetical protein